MLSRIYERSLFNNYVLLWETQCERAFPRLTNADWVDAQITTGITENIFKYM